MNPRDLNRVFELFLQRDRVNLAASPEAGFAAMIDFYVRERADGCDVDADEDMLLFQWGTYDWGEGERFEVDIVRQVMLPGESDDDALWQLHLTYRCAPSERLAALGTGNRWCSSPAEVGEFWNFVQNAPALAAITESGKPNLDLSFERAG